MGVAGAIRGRLRAADAVLCIALLGGSSACTEPRFVDPDAQSVGDAALAPDESSIDGSSAPTCDATCAEDVVGDTPFEPPFIEQDGGPSDAASDAEDGSDTLDEAQRAWVGTFATRSFLFAYDSPLKSSSRLLTRVTIEPDDDGGLRFEEELCLFEGSWSFFFTGILRFEYPSVRYTAELTFDAEHFETPLAIIPIGYSEDLPAACASGAGSALASDAQTWLTSTCDCPSETSEIPSSKRDCRLTDPESDGAPGVTIEGRIETSVLAYYGAQEQRLRIVNGYRVGDRLFGEREFGATTHVLGCAADGQPASVDSCPLGSALPCPSRHNKMELSRIPDALRCDQIIQQEPGLFPSPQPDFPASCPSEVSGG